MQTYTPVQDKDYKTDIIEHVNQSHLKELLVLAQSRLGKQISSAYIADIYNQGVLLGIKHAGQTEEEQAFIAFELDGDLEEQILYLTYTAMLEQGVDLSGQKQHFFSVFKTEKITKNILRIYLESTLPLPENAPAYAYGFSIKTLSQMPKKVVQKKSNSYLKQVISRFFLWSIKYVSSRLRRRLLSNMGQNLRYYTLHQTWRSSSSVSFCNQGSVDVFLHGDTLGSNWAKSLKAGDVIRSQYEVPDKHEHLHQGHTVLIADETAYPALAGILAHWQNPQAPHIFILSAQASEQNYFKEQNLPTNTHITRLVGAYTEYGNQVVAKLQEIAQIDGAWGALEHNAAKIIRYYLRNERQLTGKQNQIKAYWREQK